MTLNLSHLNEKQREAVVDTSGPLIILAGAGSGKTRVLTYKAAYLIVEKRVDPQSILMVTFTNKAAGEMKERISDLVGESRVPQASTFHSFCARVLRREGKHLGLSSSYVIYDESDQLEVAKRALVLLGIDSKKVNPRSILNAISSAKNELIEAGEYQSLARGYFGEIVAKTYTLYEAVLKKNQAVDFDDLLLYVVKFLKTDIPASSQLREKYEYILVDEYQDTNHAQYVLTKLLGSYHKNICIVGDVSQSIYSFRGANYRNIMNFREDFPESRIVNLEQNYRSTQNILSAATSVISKNTSHPILTLWTDKGSGDKISIYEAGNEQEEAIFIINTVVNRKGSFAVLYRTNAQSRVIEEAFLHHGIPYSLVGGVRFYERKEIKDVLAFLKFYYNSKDAISFARIQKIGKRRSLKYLDYFEKLKKEKRETYTSLDLLDGFVKACDYLSLYTGEDEADMQRLENIKELRSVASQFPQIDAFLENVALIESEYLPSGKMLGDSPQNAQNSIVLMTIHGAKGLEFDHVFLVGMEEGLFPHSQSLMEREEIEEERRLCYVALTRARVKLYLSYAQRRLYFGRHTNNMPSRFLVDIPQTLVEYTNNF